MGKISETMQSELQKLLEKSKSIITDLIFFDEEVKFFRNYIQSIFKDEEVGKVQLLETKLSHLVMVKANIAKDALTQQGNFEVQFKDINAYPNYFFRNEYHRIKEELNDLHRNFKHIKREVFQLSADTTLNKSELILQTSID